MTRGVLAATVVLLLLLASPTSAAATTDTAEMVTLTVSIENQDGARVGSAELTATWENGSNTETTASNGKAFVDVPKGANVTISVSHPDYIRNNPVVIKNVDEQSVTIPVYQRGQLNVNVDDGTGAIADANVVLRKDGKVAVSGPTNANGVFSSPDIEQGTYTASVVKPGHYRNMTTVAVNESAETRVMIERGTVTLTLAVRDPHFSSPTPLDNATVTIKSIGQFQTLDDGQAGVTVPVNTDYSLTVTKDGYKTVTKTAPVAEADRRVNVSLSRTPSLTVTPLNRRVVAGESVIVEVTDEYNESVEGATVLLDDESVGTTDEDGQVTVTVDNPGDYTFVASTNGLESSPATIEAISGEDSTATATATETESGTDMGTETDVGVPGFTVVSAMLALVSGLAILARRRQ